MADNSQILRHLGYNWLECQDEQGIFYWNEVTQQSSDTVPPELLGAAAAPGPVNCAAPMAVAAPMAAAQHHPGKAKVIAGGITPTSSYIPHMQAHQQMYAPQQQAPPQQAYPQHVYAQQAHAQHVHPQQVLPMHYQQQHMMPPTHQPHPVVSSYTPLPQAVQPQVQQPQPQTAPAVQKMAFGDWAVYQDELGTFYMHVPTGQQYERPPPDLMNAYRQYRAEQDQLHMQQMQQIELQKQQIDQQMMQQTEALRRQYGIPNGVSA